jgi:hypothetical protein
LMLHCFAFVSPYHKIKCISQSGSTYCRKETRILLDMQENFHLLD